MSSLSSNRVIAALVTSADSVGCNVSVVIGSRVSPSGKASPLYARFKLPVACLGLDDVLSTLRKLGAATLTITMPRLAVSDLVAVSLRPVYSGKVLAGVLEALHAPADSNGAAPAPKGKGKGKDAQDAPADSNGAAPAEAPAAA